MELRKLILLFCIQSIFFIKVNAQTMGINFLVNHLTNGVNIEYGQNLSKGYSYNIGLKAIVNTFKYNDNKESFIYYQNGYAKKVYERFALNFRVNKSVYKYKRLKICLSLNTNLSYHSLLQNSSILYWDTTLLQNLIRKDIIYTKPALSIEGTIGPNLSYKISKLFTLQTFVGFGGILMNYSYTGKSMITGLEQRRFNPLHPQRTKGDFEFVGYDGLPVLLLGITYNIKKR